MSQEGKPCGGRKWSEGVCDTGLRCTAPPKWFSHGKCVKEQDKDACPDCDLRPCPRVNCDIDKISFKRTYLTVNLKSKFEKTKRDKF